MSCPSCSHTMQHVGITGNGGNVFHCPQCGTVSQQYDAERFDYVPKLVPRCREYRKAMLTAREAGTNFGYDTLWHTLGIRESINREGERS